MNISENLEASPSSLTWKEALQGEREKPYFVELLAFIEAERKSGKTIYPINSEIFNAMAFTSFEDLKVVIIGQDPYHGPNQAHGLCFSVKSPTSPPPSLVNIFKELKDDLGILPSRRGDLEKWAHQGVLLLNAVLTVEATKPGSHAGRGWETFTDRIISEVSLKKENVIFLLWGSYAEKKATVVDRSRHILFSAPHPSPLSAHRGFLGCKHFSKTNEQLIKLGKTPIAWEV